jgi:hypothetical protein
VSGRKWLWLEHDDLIAQQIRGEWKSRAVERVTRDAIDMVFTENVSRMIAGYRDGRYKYDPQLTELRQLSCDASSDRPWLKAKQIYPISTWSGDDAIVALVASLALDPPLPSSRTRGDAE